MSVLTALDVARSAGLDVRQKGSRWWTCCPLHSEKTASFCFFPDGKWKCFGCGKYGDAADLYVALYGVSLGEALRVVNGEAWRPKPRQPSASDLRRTVETWKSEQWHKACLMLHTAQVIISHAKLDDNLCWQAIDQMARAEDWLNALESATPKQLLRWMVNDGN